MLIKEGKITLTPGGIEKVIEVYKTLENKDAAERSSYMQINPNKDSNGEESVWLRICDTPVF